MQQHADDTDPDSEKAAAARYAEEIAATPSAEDLARLIEASRGMPVRHIPTR